VTNVCLLAAAALAAAAVAGCGSESSGPPPVAATPVAATASAVTVVRSQFGRILADGRGRALYYFSRAHGRASRCSGACAKAWPPATSAPGLDKAKLSTIKRSDGTMQVALAGHPLYRFSGDMNPGDANGQGSTAFGGVWKTATPAAKKAEPKPSSSYGY